MWPLLAAIGPRILIPGFFIGSKVSTMNDTVQIFQTLALSALFVSFAVTLFSDNAWLSIIPGIAAWAYWNMMHDSKNTDFYRYTDWILTTPIMLLAILKTNGASFPIIFATLVLDILMIATGYLGMKEFDENKKKLLFGLGCLALLPILYVIFKMKKAKYAIYLTLILWTLYPAVWYAEEDKSITKNTANISYSIMDVLAKVGLINLLHV